MRKQIRTSNRLKLKGSLMNLREKPLVFCCLRYISETQFTSLTRRRSDFHYKLCTHGHKNTYITQSHPFNILESYMNIEQTDDVLVYVCGYCMM